jgi:hypothetical protein
MVYLLRRKVHYNVISCSKMDLVVRSGWSNLIPLYIDLYDTPCWTTSISCGRLKILIRQMQQRGQELNNPNTNKCASNVASCAVQRCWCMYPRIQVPGRAVTIMIRLHESGSMKACFTFLYSSVCCFWMPSMFSLSEMDKVERIWIALQNYFMGLNEIQYRLSALNLRRYWICLYV